MSEVYIFIAVLTYIGTVLVALVKSEKIKGGAGLIIGAAIMGVGYALIWPLFFLYLAWYFLTDQESKP